MRLRSLRLAVAFGLLAACDVNPTGEGGGNCTPTATRVCMINSAFTPADLTVPVGTMVIWVNNDNLTHSVKSAVGAKSAFASGPRDRGEGFAFTFGITGPNPYYCEFHGEDGIPPTGMRGSITVTP